MDEDPFDPYGDDRRTLSDINVTPLVDVMLVLLIVFMITMPVLTHTVPLQLPSAASDDAAQEKKEQLRVSIDANGDYFMGGQRMGLGDVAARLRAEKAGNPDPTLAISADKAVAYERVADALGVAQNAGVFKIGFITEIKDGEGPALTTLSLGPNEAGDGQALGLGAQGASSPKAEAEAEAETAAPSPSSGLSAEPETPTAAAKSDKAEPKVGLAPPPGAPRARNQAETPALGFGAAPAEAAAPSPAKGAEPPPGVGRK